MSFQCEKPEQNTWRLLAQWRLESRSGNQFQAAELVASVVKPFQLSEKRLTALEIVVVEATLNALEHGNQFDQEKSVLLEVLFNSTAIAVRIHDQGTSGPIDEPAPPDLAAKLAERETPRGWGLFLIRHLSDEMHLSGDAHSHMIEIVFSLDGGLKGHQEE